ncbi:hypothetical protein ACFODL_17895 [Phenylobacterium terrae]|uniref:Uncharacterized protein n=1 Tax=Phenylobacterium terrae TaxID=2665495 RepID=A0ABW4N6H1_9CAUL
MKIIRTALLAGALLAPQTALGQPLDRYENRWDRREGYLDRQTDLGPADRYEDRWDRRENRWDRRDLTGYGANYQPGYGLDYRPGYYPPRPGYYYPPAAGYYGSNADYAAVPARPVYPVQPIAPVARPGYDYYACQATYAVTRGRWVWNGWRWVMATRRDVVTGRC